MSTSRLFLISATPTVRRLLWLVFYWRSRRLAGIRLRPLSPVQINHHQLFIYDNLWRILFIIRTIFFYSDIKLLFSYNNSLFSCSIIQHVIQTMRKRVFNIGRYRRERALALPVSMDSSDLPSGRPQAHRIIEAKNNGAVDIKKVKLSEVF